MLDLVIRGGEVVDGTGALRRRADVGVQGERIVAVGNVSADAATVIDATGKVVTPGFVDVHTHYDAQVFWDGDLTPSPLHGVTTVLSGNCGFSIAPLSGDAADGEYLMRMLARVEGMSIDVLRQHVPWNWTSTASYLDAIEGRLGINAGFMVGHSAIRRLVMGAEATDRAATDDELAAMCREVDDACEAGALGFSSSWARTHNDAEGRMVPSRCATRDELVELSRRVGRFPGTSLELIPMVGAFEPWAVELMVDMSAAAARPLNWNLLAVNAHSLAAGLEKLDAGDVARARGGKVVALTMPSSIPVRLSFASGFVLDSIPGWEPIMAAPRDEKLAVLADQAARARLAELAASPDNPLPGLVDWAKMVVYDVAASENEMYRGRTLGAIGRDEGREPWDVLCDIAVADELRTSFGAPAPELTRADWEARVSVARDRRAVIGGSDAGAHLDLLATFNYATVLLAEAVRRHQVLSLEEAVHLLTDVPAQLYGVRERGRVAVGWYADLVVLDPARVASREIAMRFDLPGGGGRLSAGAEGLDDVVVNGAPVVTGGELTGSRTGKVLRSGTATATPSLD
jgi:N-acyl-D-aspartate/D-glutamate deacylase